MIRKGTRSLFSRERIKVFIFSLDGGGFTGVEHPSSVTYHAGDNAENEATLTISSALDDSSPAITLTVTGLHDTTPATAAPAGPLALVTAGSANVIDYIADLTAPTVIGVETDV